MKQIGAAAMDAAEVAKQERHRRNAWCRLWNDFLDKPVLRVAAARAQMPLFQVQAFVTRLDSLANKSEPRGYVGDFSPAEFAAAHDMPVEQAALLFATLEHPDIGWIVQEHLTGFYDRNRDREEDREKARVRQQRVRDRKKIRDELARRARLGLIGSELRDAVESMLELIPDDELAVIKRSLLAGMALEPTLSTASTRHLASRRDSVTVTPRADQIFKQEAENLMLTPTAAPQAIQGNSGENGDKLADPAQAELWLATEGLRIVVERMNETKPRAQQRLDRWLAEIGGNHCALAAIVDQASMSDLVVARFLTIVKDAIDRHRHAQNGPALPLRTVISSERKRGNG